MPDACCSVGGVRPDTRSRQILFGVDFAVVAGEVVALLGANGSGKSTCLNARQRLRPPLVAAPSGCADRTRRRLPHQMFRHGIVQVSQARDLFPDMSVEENLRLGGWVRGGPCAACWTASMPPSRGWRNDASRSCA